MSDLTDEVFQRDRASTEALESTHDSVSEPSNHDDTPTAGVRKRRAGGQQGLSAKKR